jgi:transcriptional regulator of nitric oxide reductase
VLKGDVPLSPRSISAAGASAIAGSSPTVYIATVEFDAARWWDLSLNVDRADERTEGVLVRF